MLHNRHQLHMGIAHFHYIRNQLVRNFPVIGIFFVILWCKEAAQIQFVYTDGRIFLLEGLSLFDKLFIFPLKVPQIRYHRCRFRAELRRIAVRVGFQIRQSGFQFDFVFVVIPRLYARDKDFKNTAGKLSHLVHSAVPMIEITHSAHTQGIRCPHGKIHAVLSV